MEEIYKILQNSKLTEERIQANLMHPVLKTSDYKPREIFTEITDISDNYFNNKSAIRMVGLAGLRGTGKTTLLWQSADFIYKKFTKNIYFFHLGQLRKYDIGVREIYEAIEKYLANEKLWSYKEKIILLFDEIHEDPNWANDLKILYDLFPVAFVIATGSSALLLQSTADLVTRMLIRHVYPLNFTEYLSITQNEVQTVTDFQNNLKEILFYSKDIKDFYANFQKIQTDIDKYFNITEISEDIISDYILYHNITRFSLESNKEIINSLISDLIKRVIYEDIPKLTPKRANELISEKILKRIAASDEVNIQTLSQSLGISQKEINENLETLVKAELLNVLYPYGGIDTKINKTQKYFFMSPSIRRVILNPLIGSKYNSDLFAKLLEDMTIMYLKRIFRENNIVSFTSFKKGKNPDLVIETHPLPIILEIGINKKATKQITKSKIKYKYGLILSLKAENITVNEDDNIVILPFKYFLLL